MVATASSTAAPPAREPLRRTLVRVAAARLVLAIGALAVSGAFIGVGRPGGEAAETALYRKAVARALGACGLRPATHLDADVRARAVAQLGPDVDATLKAFSHRVGTPWRAQEKQAALAAWLALPAR